MEMSAQQSQVTQAYPPPPSYFRLFDQNASALEPPPPVQGEYKVFGETFNTEKDEISLEAFNIVKLHSDGIHGEKFKEEVLRLHNLQLLVFSQLVETLVKTPDDGAKQVESLRMIFANVFHLLNLYRPYQARDALISVLRARVSELEAVSANINKYVSAVNNVSAELDDLQSHPSGLDSLLQQNEDEDVAFTEAKENLDSNCDLENEHNQDLCRLQQQVLEVMGGKKTKSTRRK